MKNQVVSANTYHMPLPQEIKEVVRNQAEKEGRTINSLGKAMVVEYIQRHGGRNDKAIVSTINIEPQSRSEINRVNRTNKGKQPQQQQQQQQRKVRRFNQAPRDESNKQAIDLGNGKVLEIRLVNG